MVKKVECSELVVAGYAIIPDTLLAFQKCHLTYHDAQLALLLLVVSTTSIYLPHCGRGISTTTHGII